MNQKWLLITYQYMHKQLLIIAITSCSLHVYLHTKPHMVPPGTVSQARSLLEAASRPFSLSFWSISCHIVSYGLVCWEGNFPTRPYEGFPQLDENLQIWLGWVEVSYIVDGNQKSGGNAPVEVKVIEIPVLTTGFSTIRKGGDRKVSEPSTV